MHPDIAAPKREYNLLTGKNNDDILKDILGFSNEEINKLKNPWKNTIFYSEKVLNHYIKKTNKKKICLKLPYYIIYLDNIYCFFPNLKFINIIRDGRDVACSLRTHPKWKIVDGKVLPTEHKNSFKWCVRRWVSCINNGFKWKNSKNFYNLKYENLINDTKKEMDKLFEFLNLDAISEKNLLSFYKYEKNEDHFQNIEVGKSIYKKSIGRWKKDLNKNEIEIFKKMAGNLLIKLDYEKSNNWK